MDILDIQRYLDALSNVTVKSPEKWCIVTLHKDALFIRDWFLVHGYDKNQWRWNGMFFTREIIEALENGDINRFNELTSWFDHNTETLYNKLIGTGETDFAFVYFYPNKDKEEKNINLFWYRNEMFI